MRVPEHAEAALVVLDPLDCLDGAVDAEHLVVLGDNLLDATARLLEPNEVLHQIEEAAGFAGAPQHPF